MSYLTASNVATLVAWHSGSGAVSGSFDTRTHWDGARPFGDGSYTLWRMHTSSTRNWEWYLYIQDYAAQSFAELNGAAYTQCAPILAFGGTGLNGGDQATLFQAAVCFSGSTSFNPWNGTITDGFSQATSPRWVSGSNDRTMYIFPRSNSLGGNHSTNRQNAITFGRIGYASNFGAPRSMRFHIIYDGDALLVVNDVDNNATYFVTYVGAFELRNQLTSSGICNSSHGFLAYTQCDFLIASTIDLNVGFGDTAGGSAGTARNGGIAIPVQPVNGSKSGIFNTIENFLGSTYQPNSLTNKYDEFPVYIGFSENPYVGYVGTLNTGLTKLMIDVGSHDMKSDFSRAIIGGTTTLTNVKISIPWTGSLAIGTGTDRTGSNYTWTTNYG
jgi:hypothetical protein